MTSRSVYTAQVRWSDPDQMGHIKVFDGSSMVARSEVVMVAYSYPDASKRPLTEDERVFLSQYVGP